MTARMADLLIDGAIAGDGTANSVVEYLIELERRRHELLLKNGCLDFEALRSRLRALEVDIAGLSTGFPTEQNDDVISIDNISKSPLKLDTVSEGGVNLSANSSAKPDSAAVDELETSIRSMDMKLEMETEHEANVRRSSLQSTGSAKERLGSIHSKQHRRLSIGSQPLYTMPNAFQYGIKLRDTKMNGMSMYEEPVEVGDVTAAASTASPADKRVQGSRERETNIRSITDKFSDSLNGSERASMDLRRALNAGEIVTNRTSFSMGAGSAQQPKQRAHSSDQRAHSSDQQAPSSLSSSTGPSLAKALLSGGGHNALMGDFDADMTLDSIDAPKRHSLMDLAEVMDEGDELLRGEGLSEEGDRLGSDASSAPEGAIEFCIVEADWAQLHQQSQQGHLLTPLLPPRRSWRYPMDLEDSAENNTKELQDQSFFFPSGVKVDLVWPSVAALRSRSNKHIRHIVPFTDAHGKPTYACVLTVTQTYDVSEIAQLGDLILPNLVNINRQKQSARCIQKCFRQYVAYRKMVTWQHKAVALPKPVAVDSPSLMRTSTIFGRMSSSSYPNVKEARTLDTSAHGGSSSTSGTGSAAGDGTTPTVQQQSRRTWSSFFSTSSSSRNNQPSSQPGSDVLDASSLHGAKRPGGGAVRSTSITNGVTTSGTSTPTQPSTSAANAYRRKSSDTATTSNVAITAAELAQAAARRQAAQQESQAEYIRKRVAVAQKAYCIISSSREYTYIFKVLDAIAGAEGFTDPKKQATGPLPFSSTLSTDDDESDDAGPDGRSSTCSSDIVGHGIAHGASPVNVVPGAALQPTTPFSTLSPSEHLFSASSRKSNFSCDSADATDFFTLSNRGPGTGTPTASCKANTLFAAMDAYYHQFRLQRDAYRNEFLQEVESFLLDHLTAPAPTAIQQITSEFAFSPGAAVAPSAKLKTSGQNKAGSRGLNDYVNSPILTNHFKTRAPQQVQQQQGQGQGQGSSSSSASTKPSTLTPSPRGSLSRAARAHTAATRQQQHPVQGKAREQQEAQETDLNNRFAHYSELGLPTIHQIRVPGYIEDFRIDLKALLTTKEWTCAVLLTHLSSTIIFKIINLLLMEKSLIIHGKNAGIVTTITMAVINLVSPFLWEGIFVPLVPDNARELFGAPVPLIVGTTSAPRVTDVSSDTAILFLNDDNVTITSYPDPFGGNSSSGSGGENGDPLFAPKKSTLKFVAWFVRLPEVSADLPSELEMCRRLDYTSSLLCDFVKGKLEYKEEPAIPMSKSRWSLSSPATAIPGTATPQAASRSASASASSAPPPPAAAAAASGPVDRVAKITNTIDSLLMSGVPVHILHHVRVLIVAIKRFNYGFCGCVISDPGSWKRFLRHSNRTGADEFYPEYFMEPLRNHLEFQDAIVHTQLFVSFMDKLRKEQCLLDTFRRFIAEWVYFRFYLRNKQRYMNRLQFLLDR